MRYLIIVFVMLAMVLCLNNNTYASLSCKELPPIEDIDCNMSVMISMCGLQISNAITKKQLAKLKGESPPADFENNFACIEANKNDIKPLYKSVSKNLKKNKEATAILKDIYAYWITSMGYLDKGKYVYDDQSFKAYKNEINERIKGIEERLVRLKVETE